MNKKIKTLVQKYEKDMQFENRFDELKDKLDLIPDQNLNTDIIVIRKKLVPAYTMMIVLLMLVTGIIGLQFGLNSGYITGPERVDLVEEKLAESFEKYIPEAINTYVINDSILLSLYVGNQLGQPKMLIRIISKSPEVSLVGTIDSNIIEKTDNSYYYTCEVNDGLVTVDLKVYRQGLEVGSLLESFDLSSYYSWLQE